MKAQKKQRVHVPQHVETKKTIQTKSAKKSEEVSQKTPKAQTNAAQLKLVGTQSEPHREQPPTDLSSIAKYRQRAQGKNKSPANAPVEPRSAQRRRSERMDKLSTELTAFAAQTGELLHKDIDASHATQLQSLASRLGGLSKADIAAMSPAAQDRINNALTNIHGNEALGEHTLPRSLPEQNTVPKAKPGPRPVDGPLIRATQKMSADLGSQFQGEGGQAFQALAKELDTAVTAMPLEALSALDRAQAQVESLPWPARRQVSKQLEQLAPKLQETFREPAMQQRAQMLKDLTGKQEEVQGMRKRISAGIPQPKTPAGRAWMRKQLGPMGGRFLDFQSALGKVKGEAGSVNADALSTALSLGKRVASDFSTALAHRNELDRLQGTLADLQALKETADAPQWTSMLNRVRDIVQPWKTGHHAPRWKSLVSGLDRLEEKLKPFSFGDRHEIKWSFESPEAERKAVSELQDAVKQARASAERVYAYSNEAPVVKSAMEHLEQIQRYSKFFEGP